MLLPRAVLAFDDKSPSAVDVAKYHVVLEPNITNKSIRGNVVIDFYNYNKGSIVTFDSGDLIVDRVEGRFVKSFKQEKSTLIIELTTQTDEKQGVEIFFRGEPRKGLVFLTDKNQIYTVFSTDEWLVSNKAPSDKAKITMELIVPINFMGIGNGILVSRSILDEVRQKYIWNQEVEVPTYTFGFVVGEFNHVVERVKGVSFQYYSSDYTENQLRTIFSNSEDMLDFFQEKSGIPFYQNSYSQILIGNHYQEMAGFAVLKSSYGRLVLNDVTETNLISHELAHQWWGNLITSKNWNHFWLNEAFATFMSAAYNEHRFGREQYLKDIKSYREVYLDIKKRGLDKKLHFQNWDNPTRDDRNLIYFKGAYVLHLLREKMGDEHFWKGIKMYSQTFKEKSVVSRDFQNVMEQSGEYDLQDFFDNWIY